MAGRYPEKATVTNIGDSQISDKVCDQKAQELKPKGLTKEESEIWDRICPQLVQERGMKGLFVDALETYCFTIARMVEIRRDLKKEGRTYVVEGRNGTQEKNRPEIAEYNELFRQFNSMVAQFGLSAGTEKRFVTVQLGLFDDDNQFNKL